MANAAVKTQGKKVNRDRFVKDHVKNIGSVMVKKIISVAPKDSSADAAMKLSKFKIGCVVVIENGELVGIVSERDIATKVAALRKSAVETKVHHIMTRKIFTARMDDSLVKVCGIMQRKHIRHIPVVDDANHVLGILSMRDLLTRIEANLRNLVKERTKDLNIDALTGLYNYRFFNNYLDAEIARSSRHGHRLSLMFIDLDHFKVFNDTHGHAKGNMLLKEVSQLLRAREGSRMVDFAIRKSDIAVRVGGDEFVLVLPETPKEGALYCAERLRQAIDQRVYTGKKNQPGHHVTVSIGIAEFPTDANTKKDLVEKADQALYQAKKLGRNRVYLYA